MNFSALTGIIGTLIVLYFATMGNGSEASLFVNKEGFLIVIGGTLCASVIMFSIKRLFVMIKVFVMKVLLQRGEKPENVIQEIIILAKNQRTQPGYLTQAVSQIKNPFLR